MKFKQLSPEQQARAIDAHRYINVNHDDWNDFVKDKHHDIMKEHGFNYVESQYQGFCSQGDGASFTADSIDIEKFLRKVKRWSAYRPLHEQIKINDITAKAIRTDHRYSHYNTTEVQLSCYLDLTDKQYKLFNELETEIDEFLTQAGKDYYSDLDDAYSSMTNDDNVKETIIANEMDFEQTDYSVTYI